MRSRSMTDQPVEHRMQDGRRGHLGCPADGTGCDRRRSVRGERSHRRRGYRVDR
ncbi:Uncharacterised protein [Mycobacterium tuberculosis]|uniref:Uncharacterized protein n=1 Tax=Mycobacterium tuberculosis TaxID=1773 RepID=A0A0U0R9Q0_MYCTX|nr:Uncharacterised protein [Mycobacterium tuberculosis]